MSHLEKSGIETRLRAVRRRIRRVQRTRGLLLVLAVLLLGWLVAIGFDLLISPLPQAARFGILGGWLVAVIWASIRGLGPSFRRLDLVRIARWLEHRHPEIEERLSTALEVSKDDRSSGELVAMLLEAADVDAGRVDPESEVTPGRSTKRWRWVVVACLVVFLASLIVLPKQTVRLMWRAVAPLSDVGNAGALSFVVEPEGLEVLEGDPIEIRVTHDEVPELVIELESGESLVQPMVRDADVWVYRLEPAREGFRYRARSGRAESDAFRAVVWPLARMTEGTRTLTFPPYTDLAPTSHGMSGPLEAVVGTELGVAGMLNTAVESAWIERGDGSRVDVVLTRSAEQTRAEVAWRLDQVGTERVAMKVKHRLGQEMEVLQFEVVTVADEEPVVVLLQPARDEIRVRPDEMLDLRYEVAEDFGVSGVKVMVDTKGKGTFGLDQWLPERIENSGVSRFRGAAPVAVGEVLERAKGAREFRLRVMAEDGRPAETGGPGRGYSEWLVVKVDQGAESLARQELRSAGEDARKTLERAKNEIRMAEQRMHQNRPHLEKAGENPHSERLSEQTVEKLTAAEEKLEDLAKRMEEGIHAKESPKVEKAAAKVEEALEAFEEVPLQDDRDERKEKLDEAVEAAKEAVKGIEEVRRALEKARPQVEDLARVEELAQRQEELARQAESFEEEAVPESWKREQERLAAELRAQLERRPEAMAEALKEQAEQTEELAREGQALSEEQAQLERMVADESASETDVDALREELAEAQNQLAEEVQAELSVAEESGEATRRDEEIADLAKQAAEALASDDQSVEDAAEATRDAAEAMQASNEESEGEASEEKTAENAHPSEGADGSHAQMLAERQEQLADAAEALAEGNLEDAADALAEAQGDEGMNEAVGEMLAEAQAEIAGEVGELLVEARQQRSPMADLLPEVLSEATQASEALEQGNMQAAADEAAESSEAMEGARSEAESVAQEASSSSPGEAMDAAAKGEAMAELEERQEAVAEAAQAMAEGDIEGAMMQLQEMKAAEAQEFSEAVAAMPALPGSSLHKAEQSAEKGSQQAAEALAQSQQGEPSESAKSHGEASQSLSEAVEALDRASEQLSARSESMAQRESGASMAPVDASSMAEAFREASEAAAASASGEAVAEAKAAAESLAEAAQAARSSMRGEPMPKPPGLPGPAPGIADVPGDQPGDEPSGDERLPQPDPGVPGELAKLGVSASDWEKIQATLNSDVGAGSSGEVPEDYRELVRDYFQNMTK